MSLWRWPFRLPFPGRGGGCHSGREGAGGPGEGKVILVGSPNVGKSALFNRLTGSYVTVSNYPGTTVEVSRGRMKLEGRSLIVIDTPGMYSLRPLTEEERIARTILFREAPDVVIHVVDAKNLDRMLPVTFQLIEAGLPVILALNMMDELKAAGMELDIETLRKRLGIPVVATVATTGEGVKELKEEIDKKLWQRRTSSVTMGR